MAGKKTMHAVKYVRPMMSLDCQEAHRRVMALYRAFFRYIPYIEKYMDVPKSKEDMRWKIREYFYNNASVTDIRVIDLLVIKGYMDLAEIKNQWIQKGRIMSHWNPSLEPVPQDFLSKFLNQKD